MLKYIEEDTLKTAKLWGKEIRTPLSFLYQIVKKMSNGYSPIVGICGPQRGGKSFIGVWLAYQIYLLKGEEFDPTTITFYEPDKAMQGLEDRDRDVLFIDEAGDVMDYQEWHKQTHRALRSMINTQAYRNNLYIFISPFLVQIDKSIRIHCDFIINVRKRGNFKVWKTVKKYDADKIDRATYKVFLDDVSIKMRDLPKDIWNKYKEFSFIEKEKIRQKRVEDSLDKKEFTIDHASNLSRKNKGEVKCRQSWEA